MLNLAVIFGSRTCEHDVSIISALQLMDAADKEKYNIIPVYITPQGAWYTGDALRSMDTFRAFDSNRRDITRVLPDVTAKAGRLLAWREKPALFGRGYRVVATIDVVIPVLHGMNGEDGTVQGLLELADLPYASTGLVGSAVGMDKIAMKLLFRGCGFPVLPDTWCNRETYESDPEGTIARIEAALAYPMFVKPANLGSSIGISQAKDRDALVRGLETAFAYDRRVLIEKGMADFQEVNCAVMGFGDEVIPSPCEMPVRWEEFLTFDEKYLRGASESKVPSEGMRSLQRQLPAPIGEEMTARVQQLACDIFRALDCKSVVRVDFMLEGGNVYVEEINTIPGSLAYYLWEAMDIPFAKLIDRMVGYALRAHAAKEANVFAYNSEILSSVQLGGAKDIKGTAK